MKCRPGSQETRADKRTDTFRTLQGSQSSTQKAQSGTRSSNPKSIGRHFQQHSADLSRCHREHKERGHLTEDGAAALSR